MPFPNFPSSSSAVGLSREGLNIDQAGKHDLKTLSEFYGTTPENFANYILAKDLREAGVPLPHPEMEAWLDAVIAYIAAVDRQSDEMLENSEG